MRAASIWRISLIGVGKDALEMSKRGGLEFLRRLAFERALSDIVLSVVPLVIMLKLMLCGDIEKNPGPGELDYNQVDESTALGRLKSKLNVKRQLDIAQCSCIHYNQIIVDKGDLSDVMEEIISIQSKYYALGRSLRLEACDLKAIREAYPIESDSAQALEDVLLLWLDLKYDAKKYGYPSWRMLVVAVDKETGGNSHELAKKIADRHPAG